MEKEMLLMVKSLKKARMTHDKIKIIHHQDINDTIIGAYRSSVYRLPILLNDSFSEVPQRFVNCLTKQTYVRPHNHALTQHWELMSWIEGIAYVIFFDEKGNVTDKFKMSHDGIKVIEIPPDKYHSFVTPDFGIYLEIRNCTYEPEFDRVYAPWSPAESTEQAKKFVANLLAIEEKLAI